MKKFGIKALVVFLLIMVLCTFMSRTVMYYLTPKVTEKSVISGRINQNFTITGCFNINGAKDISLCKDFDYPVYIEAIDIGPGCHIKKGEPIAHAAPSKQILSAIKQADELYREMTKRVKNFKENLYLELINIEKKIVLKQDEIYNLIKIRASLTSTETRVLSKNTSLISFAQKELEYYKQKRDRVNSGDMNGVSLSDLHRSKDDARHNLLELKKEADNCSIIKSPLSGTIVKIYIKEDEYYDKSRPFLKILPDKNKMACVRIKIPQYTLSYIKKDMDCIVSYKNTEFEGVVSDLLYEEDFSVGKEDVLTAVVKPCDKFYKTYSDLIKLNGRRMAVLITCKSQMYDVTIPNSCIIEKQDRKYVYVLEGKRSFWGEEYHVVETPVTLGESNERKSSVIKGLSTGAKVADYWSKPLSNNDRVVLLSE